MDKRFFLLLGVFLLFLPFAFAQTEVKVGVYVLNIGKFDISSGSYTVDFYLSLSCNEECHPENFEFTNGRAKSIDLMIDKPNEKFYRIQAELAENIDLKNYPFDEHDLKISIEDKKNTIDKIVYVVDEESSGIDPSIVLVGWDLAGHKAEVTTHYYAPYDETFSRYVSMVHVKRIFLASVMKTMLPIFFIVIAGLLGLFFYKASELWVRATINTSTLIAAVMFHLNLTSSIPPVGYLTFADKFMIATYLVVIVSLLTTVIMMRHATHEDEKMLYKIYHLSLYVVPAITVAAYLAVILI